MKEKLSLTGKKENLCIDDVVMVYTSRRRRTFRTVNVNFSFLYIPFEWQHQPVKSRNCTIRVRTSTLRRTILSIFLYDQYIWIKCCFLVQNSFSFQIEKTFKLASLKKGKFLFRGQCFDQVRRKNTISIHCTNQSNEII